MNGSDDDILKKKRRCSDFGFFSTGGELVDRRLIDATSFDDRQGLLLDRCSPQFGLEADRSKDAGCLLYTSDAADE